MIVTIDGTSCSGKGTIARFLAQKYGFFHFDTGLLYRQVAYFCQTKNINTNNEDKIKKAIIELTKFDFTQAIQENKNVLLTSKISLAASKIATHKEVRNILIKLQRDIAKGAVKNHNGLVADGRDMGTVVFPKAKIKFFTIANLETRANRRYKQLQLLNLNVIYKDVLNDLRQRDERDATRSISPMKPASDAFILDTSDDDEDTTLNKVITTIECYINK